MLAYLTGATSLLQFRQIAPYFKSLKGYSHSATVKEQCNAFLVLYTFFCKLTIQPLKGSQFQLPLPKSSSSELKDDSLVVMP